jgi:hypothetical protein
VLGASRDGLVNRDLLYGDLAPWMLGTRQVSWSVTLLVLHSLVRLGAFGLGPPQITARACRCSTAGLIFTFRRSVMTQIERHTIQLLARRPPASDARSPTTHDTCLRAVKGL